MRIATPVDTRLLAIQFVRLLVLQGMPPNLNRFIPRQKAVE
jgi:hypothetical protein